jgi:hypothetical protein
MIKLLIDVVTAGIVALVLYACDKEVYRCELSHVSTPSINFLLLLKLCDTN